MSSLKLRSILNWLVNFECEFERSVWLFEFNHTLLTRVPFKTPKTHRAANIFSLRSTDQAPFCRSWSKLEKRRVCNSANVLYLFSRHFTHYSKTPISVKKLIFKIQPTLICKKISHPNWQFLVVFYSKNEFSFWTKSGILAQCVSRKKSFEV